MYPEEMFYRINLWYIANVLIVSQQTTQTYIQLTGILNIGDTSDLAQVRTFTMISLNGVRQSSWIRMIYYWMVPWIKLYPQQNQSHQSCGHSYRDLLSSIFPYWNNILLHKDDYAIYSRTNKRRSPVTCWWNYTTPDYTGRIRDAIYSTLAATWVTNNM